jgi:hypothetical protein
MIGVERFWAKVDKSGECWEWTAGLNNTGGYGVFHLNLGKPVLAHRYSYIIHHPLTNDLWEHREICVCHRCDNPKCVNPAHLFLGSRSDNMKDMVMKGRGLTGEKNGHSKLTEAQVREIRGRWSAGGIKKKQLALEYGVKHQVVSKIILRKSWKHIIDYVVEYVSSNVAGS